MEIHTTEEKLNALTHNIGAGLSIGGLVFLLYLTGQSGGTATHFVAFSLYGAFQILLYLSSGLTHLFTDKPHIHGVIRVVDQTSIYLLIAGTYTPVALIALKGAWGWSIFGVIWGMAILGIAFKLIMGRKKHIISDLFYIPMGWTIVVALRPLMRAAPPGLLMWVAIGGGCYTVGVFFYLIKKIPYAHVLWHLFVLGGSISFYLGFIKYLI
ncbi:PAQR family membrane homeostasis protein TrhA [Spirochaeta isovalerica]|uniref:Hemolysin III n=1 Tax=Spirochaeta isovalerica TaxID=150 RepID=A0A841RB94_9SPIO|nr:hemolysin III family protein [Spirochaeta isovalerica]MBB6480280.1 hemolysin III [Spirochaeta isovalerica]